jgi:nucleotide-binding universal stress UspA family protein
MSTPPKFGTNSLADISDFAQKSRTMGDGRIILVPVDFSDHSAAALSHAAVLAEILPATLIVLHVIHDPGEMPGYYSRLIKQKHVQRIEEAAEEVFSEFMSRVIESQPDCVPLRQAGIFTVVGLPVTRILEIVKNVDPVMVVMGSQGRTGLESLIVGSKAVQLVQLCPVPVTIVKKRVSASED